MSKKIIIFVVEKGTKIIIKINKTKLKTMKQIIKGKTYNTATSYTIGTRIKVIKSHKSKAGCEIYEHLHMRRKDDEYFIHGLVFNFNDEGNVTRQSEWIAPVDDEEADSFRSRKYRTEEYLD